MSFSVSSVFSAYKNAVIDASFFDVDICPDVWNELKRLNIWVSNTFETEYEQFLALINSEHKRDNYKQLFRKINSELNKREIDAGSEELSEAVNFKLHNDTFGLVQFISVHFPNQAVLLTANETLIERIVLNEIPVDIFNLNENSIIYSRDYASLKSEYKVLFSSSILPGQLQVTEGCVLTTGQHNVIMRKAYNNGGSEGKIYRVIDPDNSEYQGYVAKIIHPHRRTSEKMNNIVNLHKLARENICDWATLPYEVLYNPETFQPVGYMQRFIKDAHPIGGDAQYSGDLSDPECNLDQKLSETVELCLKITRQILFFNKYGVLTFDFNTDNFVHPKTPNENIIVWDTDSLGYKNYISNVAAPNSSVTRIYDLTSKNECIEYSYDKLYQGIFNLLTLGDNPLDEDTHEYLYKNEDYHSYFRRAFIPDNVMKLFDDVFSNGYPFSPEKLLSELVAAANFLKNNPSDDFTYKALCGFDVVEPIDSSSGEETVDAGGEISEEERNGEQRKKKHKWLLIALLIAALLVLIGYFSSEYIVETESIYYPLELCENKTEML